jgi:TolB protein
VSATDELKENPIFLQKQFQSSMVTSVAGVRSPWEMMPTDIYSSELNGDKIQRLTNQRGFDGEIAVHPNGRVLYFSSLRSGHLQLYSLDLKTRILTVVSKDPSVQDIEVAISPDGKSLAWVEYAQDFKTSQIVLGDVRGQKIKTLTDGMGLHLSPSWTPDGNELVFSANSNSVQVFQIYIIKKDGSCLRPLIHDNANASKPSVSPDGQSLLYTSSLLGKSQLFLLPYHSPPCLEGAK